MELGVFHHRDDYECWKALRLGGAEAADYILSSSVCQRLRQLLGLTAPVVSARDYDGTGEL